MRPLLPNRAALSPFLDEIDACRWYTNNGPLQQRFEACLAELFDLDPGQAVCVANGTLGLAVALRAVALDGGVYCLMPSYTFVATAHAAVSAGLTPWFLDVDLASWSLTPDIVRDALSMIGGPVAAVVPVAPFGAKPATSDWDEFSSETGIPVVIDAAAGFDMAAAGRAPVIVSLGATKPFGLGEGGVVLCRDNKAVEKIRAGRQFGFAQGRSAVTAGINAKLNEYSAAVGLAALAEWPRVRQDWQRTAQLYFDGFAGADGLQFAPFFVPGSVSSTCNIELADPLADVVIAACLQAGIEARRWWNRGCHQEPYFANFSTGPLKTTEFLGDRVVGLPFYRDLEADQISRICNLVRDVLSRPRTIGKRSKVKSEA